MLLKLGLVSFHPFKGKNLSKGAWNPEVRQGCTDVIKVKGLKAGMGIQLLLEK